MSQSPPPSHGRRAVCRGSVGGTVPTVVCGKEVKSEWGCLSQLVGLRELLTGKGLVRALTSEGRLGGMCCRGAQSGPMCSVASLIVESSDGLGGISKDAACGQGYLITCSYKSSQPILVRPLVLGGQRDMQFISPSSRSDLPAVTAACRTVARITERAPWQAWWGPRFSNCVLCISPRSGSLSEPPRVFVHGGCY